MNMQSFLWINRNQCKRYFGDLRFGCNSKHISQTTSWYVKVMMDAEVYFLPNDKLHCTRNTESSTYFGNFLYALIFIHTVPIVRNVLILPSKHVFVIVNFLKMRNVLCFSCKYYTKCLKCQYWSTSWDPPFNYINLFKNVNNQSRVWSFCFYSHCLLH